MKGIKDNMGRYGDTVYVTYGLFGERRCVECSSVDYREVLRVCRERVPGAERIRVNRSLREGPCACFESSSSFLSRHG